MPRKKRSASPFELMDDDFDEDASSQCSRNGNPPMRNAANARERARMRVLSSAFGRLKTKLPNIPADTKLSKLDTLRLATMYIKQLKTVVEGGSPLASVANATTHGDHLEGASILSDNCYLNLHNATQSMNWPFGFHHQLHTANTTRTTTHTSPPNSGTSTAPSWCHTETNDLKHQQPTHYDAENYQHHESRNQHNTSAYISSSHLQSVVNGQSGLEPQWYSETPSPDLSNNSSSPGGMGYDNTHHHLQQRNNLMEHLSLIQLSPTPPPPPPPPHSSSAAVTTHSSTPQSFQDTHQLAHHRPLHENHHMHAPQQHHHHHLQHHRHHHTSSQHLHQNFVNPTNFAATSIH